jgi:hypothetical protein
MSRTEPELPSIHTPVADETTITTHLGGTSIDPRHDGVARDLVRERDATSMPKLEPATPIPAANEPDVLKSAGPLNRYPTQREPHAENSPEPEPTADRADGNALDQCGREWPRNARRDPATPELTNDHSEDGHHYGWEP